MKINKTCYCYLDGEEVREAILQYAISKYKCTVSPTAEFGVTCTSSWNFTVSITEEV